MTTHAALPHQQKLNKAQAALALNQTQQTECRSRYAVLEAERATLFADADRRQTELETLRQTAEALKHQHEQAGLHAAFSVGTLAPESDGKTRAAEKERGKAERALESAQAKAETEARLEATRLQQIDTEKAAISGQLGNLERQAQQISQVIADADRAIGEAEYQEVLAIQSTLNVQLSARRAALAQTERDIEAFTDGALHRLAQWPDLQLALSQQLPFTDVETQFLETSIAFYRVLLTTGQQINIDADLQRQIKPWRSGLAEWLAPLDVSDLWAVFNGRLGGNEIRNLKERQADLEKLLAAYREQKQAARTAH